MEEARSRSSSVSCSACGDPLQPFDRFCPGCGAVVNACRSCGQRLLAGDRFCPSCGMTAEVGGTTGRVSGATKTDASGLSPWTGIFEKLQAATLGEFRVIRELGRGGMAAVFLAHDISLDRKVALKVMSPMLATDKSMVERFRREAKTGAGLRHPNIGTVYRVLENEGLYFFAMDFIRGRALDTIIRRNGVLSIAAVRALVYQIGSGLAYAHRRGIFHRDVKPANVLVSAADGVAVVTDFGIAKVTESPNQTQTGAVVGTPAYMAPEQILGREIGAEVDQYALGIMAYEMLTGTPPFAGTNFVVMHAHTEVQPRAIRDSRPECPPEVDEAILRMLAKDPNQRWPSIPYALAAMGAAFIGEEDPVRAELIRIATPDDAEAARFASDTPVNPSAPTTARWAHVTSVVINRPPAAIEVSDAFRLSASGRDAEGDPVLDAPVAWSTSDASTLSVQADGQVTAHAAGSAEIAATCGRARASVSLTVLASRVVGLQLSIPPGVLVAGDRIQLAARPVDKHQRPLAYAVQWGVVERGVAEVSPEGVLEARAPGVVEVFAEVHGVRAGARVEVASPAVQSISLSVEPRSPVVGDRIQVIPTLLDVDGHPLRGRAMTWSIEDRSLVKVITDGVYQAVADGMLRLSVTSEGKSASLEIPVTPAPVAMVRITAVPPQLVVGNSVTLEAVALDPRGNELTGRRINWSVADPSVAMVTDTGTLSALAPGEARVMAWCDEKSATALVGVQPPPIGAVRITGVPQVVYVKMPFRLAAVITDGWGKQIHRTVEWRSSNVSIVSISPTGQATVSAVGHVRIAAVVEGVEGAVELEVVEPPVPKVVVVPVLPPVARPIQNVVAAAASDAAVAAQVAQPPDAATVADASGTASPVPAVADSADAVPTDPAFAPLSLSLESGADRDALSEVDRPTEPMGIPTVVSEDADTGEGAAPPRQLPPTPVLAPRAVPSMAAPAPHRRRRRALVSGTVAGVVVLILGAAIVNHRDEPAAPPSQGVAGGSVSSTDSASAPPPATVPAPTPVVPVASRPAPSGAARSAGSAAGERASTTPKNTEETSRTAPRAAFRIIIAPQAPLRVGERATLHAAVERVGGRRRGRGRGRLPSVTWSSSKPAVLQVDSKTGEAAAVAQGQAIVRAAGGGTQTDMFVTVISAPYAGAAALAESLAALPRPEEIRAKGADLLRGAANRMIGALQERDAETVTQLFAVSPSDDADDFVETLKDQFGVKVAVVQVNQPVMTNQEGTIDYRLTVSWVSAAGPTRTRNITLRAEAVRQGGDWRLIRHGIVSGWR